jgi:pyridoxamine 5'-phosphate oxidase
MDSGEPPPARDLEDPIAHFRARFENVLWRAPELGNACVLATVDATGGPSARVVLLKDFGERGFVFFTNLLSRKAHELRHDPRAALTFYWPDFGQQVRIEGVVEAASEVEADRYFRTRPRLSQLGSWASEQSQPLASREVLLERMTSLSREFEGQPVPRPPHWGGLRLVPHRFEFWTAEPHRLHDRVVFERSGATWSKHLLYP